MKSVAAWTAIALAAVTFMVVAWRLHDVLLVVALSLAIAATLGKPIQHLEQRGWSSTLAVLVVYVLAFGTLLLLFGALVWPAVGEMDPLLRDIAQGYQSLQQHLASLTGPGMVWLAKLPPAEQVSRWLSGDLPAERLRELLGLSLGAGRALGIVSVAVILSVYWAPDRHRVERLWLSLLPPEQRGTARRLWRLLDAEVGAYIRSEVVQTLLAVLLLALGYQLLGMDYPFTLALVAGIAWLVPFLGLVLALVPMLLFGLLVDPTTALAGAVYTVAVLAVLEFAIQPRLYRPRKYWGVVLVLVMLALGESVGLVGLILAPPIALAIQLAVDELLLPPSPAPLAAADLAALQLRLTQLRGRMADHEEPPSPWLGSLVDRLEGLLAEVAISVPVVADERAAVEHSAISPSDQALSLDEQLP